MTAECVNVAITGAAGQIGYSLIPELLSGQGDVFGERIVNLRLLEVPAALPKLEGIAMEIEDLASSVKGSVDITDDPRKAFDGVDFAFLVGSRPRQPGIERADLLQANAPIFVDQGAALNDVAADGVRVLVVGNPANSNALVALSNAPDIPVDRFSAMSRLDHNRAVGVLATKLGVGVDELEDVIIWGNHSASMVIDISQATTMDGVLVTELIDDPSWIEGFRKTVAKRGHAVMEARGASSAMSAAHAAADQAEDWLSGNWGTTHSMAVYSRGEYGAPEGVVFSFPVVTKRGGVVEIVEGLQLPADVRAGLIDTGAELQQERDALCQMGVLAVER